jgi:hypothetical protein
MRRDLREKLTVAQEDKKFLAICGLANSLPFSRKLAAEPYSEPNNPIHCHFATITFASHQHLGLRSDFFINVVPTNFLPSSLKMASLRSSEMSVNYKASHSRGQ